MGAKNGPLSERFWSKVDKRGDDECWIFRNGTSRYGHIFVGDAFPGRQNRPAHQVSYLLTHGAITDRLHVLHKCDIDRCVNPSHLYLGTHQDNMNDRKNRGRTYRASGEKNVSARLCSAQVLEMRKLNAAGISYSEIGRRFGVAKSTARRNCNGQNWSSI